MNKQFFNIIMDINYNNIIDDYELRYDDGYDYGYDDYGNQDYYDDYDYGDEGYDYMPEAPQPQPIIITNNNDNSR